MSLSDSEAVYQNTGDMAEDGRMIPGYGLFRNPIRDLRTINVECWVVVEVVAQQVLNIVHPTIGSEKKRKEIIDCISRLFDSILNDKVFPYGSVPLKTYLRRGDIDFTITRSPNVEESLAHDVLALLNREEQSENAEYEVKNTGFNDVELFPYGSVPLKTYLPHGDINLIIIRGPNVEESLAHDILALLNKKEQSGNSEYEVKNTGLIDIEVCMKLRIPSWSMLR